MNDALSVLDLKICCSLMVDFAPILQTILGLREKNNFSMLHCYIIYSSLRRSMLILSVVIISIGATAQSVTLRTHPQPST